MKKSHIKIFKFVVENLKLKIYVQILKIIKNNTDENNIAHKISTFKQQISTCSFFAQKSRALDGWIRWVNPNVCSVAVAQHVTQLKIGK